MRLRLLSINNSNGLNNTLNSKLLINNTKPNNSIRHNNTRPQQLP